MTTQPNNSKTRRRLERLISDANLVSLVEMWFRSHTINLIRPVDYTVKGWLEDTDDDQIKAVFILDGPPLTKPKKKGGVRVSRIYGTQLPKGNAV